MKIPVLTDDIVRACFALGKKRFPQPLPTVYDRVDQESDFMLGLVLGSKKKWWKADNPVLFLTNNGLWTIRRRRYRLMSQKMNILCECGKKLKISQQPCHGTMDTRTVGPKTLIFDEVRNLIEYGKNAQEWLALGKGIRKRRIMIPGFEPGV